MKSVDVFLRHVPGLQSYLSHKEQLIAPLKSGENNELEWTIKHALFSLYRKKFPEKDFSENLEKVLRGFPVFREPCQTKKKGV